VLTFIDLFAGGGGFRHGMEQAGHKCLGYCEIDKYARKAYEAHFDTEGEWTAHDIRKVTDDDIRLFGRDRGTIQVVCGGFPCQAFSIAGKRRGFEDTRGTLFFEIARFAYILKPKYIFLENVDDIRNHDNGDTFETIISTLHDLGYDVEWQMLNSKDFGVPQNRERVFFVGHLRGQCTGKVFPIIGGNSETVKQVIGSVQSSSRVYDPSGISCTLTSGGGGQGAKTGLYIVKQSIAMTQKRIRPIDIAQTLTASGPSGGRGNNSPVNGVFEVATCLTPDRLEKRQNGRRFKKPGEPIFTLTAQDIHGIAITDSEQIRIRRLTPLESFRCQGYPDEFYHKAKAAGISDSQLYKIAGNAVSVPVIKAIAGRLK